MPGERSLLIVSMALQGAVALTFGLAFVGLWRGFHRRTAERWAIAWLVYGVGVVNAALGIGLGFGSSFNPLGAALYALPLQAGVLLFRAGVDALVEREPSHSMRRYAALCLVPLAVMFAFRTLAAYQVVELPRQFNAYFVPRTLMGISYAWAAWPLRAIPRARWREGFGLLIVSMSLLSVRMFVTVGFEVWQIMHGVPQRPESALLTVLQICLLIMFGLATAIVLIDAEHREALSAAETIRRTAEALSASEAKFRFVIEHSSDVALLVGADRRVRYVAPTSETSTGYPPSAFEGHDLLDLVHPADREAAQASWARLMSGTGYGWQRVVVRVRHRTEEWRPFEINGRLVIGADPGEPSVVLSARDVAEKLRLEEALRHAQRIESLGQMAGGVAHDFNNVLMVIRSAAELAQEDAGSDGRGTPYLRDITAATDRGVALTRQLLMLSRREETAPQVFDVRDRLTSLKTILGHGVGRGIDVDVVPGIGALLLKGDPTQFDQVMLNLCANARDAMPSGGTVTIRATVVDDPKDRSMRIDVEDTGHGIAADVLPKIFEPFFTTKAEGKGTGLGLASADAFARQCGGSILVESRAGAGACFSLRLPLVATDEGVSRLGASPAA